MTIGSPRAGVRAALLSAAAIACAIIFAVPASAATGDLSFDSCASFDGSAGDCADLPGTVLQGAANVVESPDGRSLYVSSIAAGSVSHFFVGPDGRLTFGGCVSDDGTGGVCANVPGAAFASPFGMTISPDGDSLYVVSADADSLSHFFVAPQGQLTFGGCVSETGSGGTCANVPGSAFDFPREVEISPDGGSVYVAAQQSGSVTHFFAAPAGQLTFGGCVSQTGSAGTCADVPGSALGSPVDIALSPDGDSLYAADFAGGAVDHFFRAPTGQISFGGCVSSDGSGGTCADVPGDPLAGANALAISPDSATVYVRSATSGSIAGFSAAPAGQITFRDCISQSGSGGACAVGSGPNLSELGSLALSADGGSLYVSSRALSSNSISHFVSAPGKPLAFSGCVSNDGSGGVCVNVPGSVLDGPVGIEVSPDGRSLYAAVQGAGSVVRFAREPAADTTPPRLTLTVGKKSRAGKPVSVTVSCDEACTVGLTGTAKPKGSKKGDLRPATASLGAGASATLKLKPKGKLKKTLRNAGKGKATIDATATDASGNSADADTKVKLK